MPTLSQLVAHARRHSPYYAQRLAHLPEQGWKLSDLPLTDPADYWRDSEGLSNWPVLSAPVDDAHVYKTGGSTGKGKLAVYRRDEWRDFVTAFGRGVATQLQPGDRVANLFFAGDLYTSFLFIHGALANSPVPVCEFPFTGAVDSAALADAVATYDINVLACVPAQLLRFAAYLDEQRLTLPSVETVLYGGESLFAAQLPQLRRVLPNARFASIGYASVDAGLLGASTPDCALGEHRVFDEDTVVEIIDEHSGEIIEDCDRTGVLVVTNLNRTLMPLLRYPVGDLAAWVEESGSPQRKFVLRGRAGQSHRVRVGTLSLFPEEIGAMVERVAGALPWQLRIERAGMADCLTLCWGSERVADQAGINGRLEAGMLECYPEMAALIAEGRLVWRGEACATADLALHPRSGKLLRVVDRRSYDARNLQWRFFTAADAPSVSELFRAVYGEHYVYPDLYLPAMISLHNAQGDWHSALALDGDRVVGHAALCCDPQDPGSAELALNAVHPDARGLGIATTLGQMLCRHARELGLHTLTIKQVSSFTQSQQMARTLGFPTTGLLLDYVSSPFGNDWRESIVLGCQSLKPGHRPLPALQWPRELEGWAKHMEATFGVGAVETEVIDTPMQVRRHGDRIEVTLERIDDSSLAEIALLPGNWLIHLKLRLGADLPELLQRLAAADYVFTGLAPAPGNGWYALLQRGFEARPLEFRCEWAKRLYQAAQALIPAQAEEPEQPVQPAPAAARQRIDNEAVALG